MEYKITPKGMMKDIFAMRRFALQLINRGKDYDNLVKCLLKKDYYYNDEERPWPSVNDIVNELGISYSVFKRQITEVYNDLEDIYCNDIDYTIKDVDYIFFLSFLGLNAHVKLQNLPVPPRVGEEVNLPFFKEKVQAQRFYIRAIHHEFSDSKQTVYIDLAVGQYNQYWNIKRDEEYAKGRMSWDDYHSKDESRIKEKYGLRWH